MTIHHDIIKKFFEEYEKESSEEGTDRVDLLYADVFLNADANGIQVVKRDDVRRAIAKRKALFKTLGSKFAKLTALEEIPLDEHYVMVKTEWHLRYEKISGHAIDTRDHSTFILFIKDDWPRIVFYHPHQDIMQEVRELGLLADSHEG